MWDQSGAMNKRVKMLSQAGTTWAQRRAERHRHHTVMQSISPITPVSPASWRFWLRRAPESIGFPSFERFQQPQEPLDLGGRKNALMKML
jgi:hypothetical protein